MKHMLRLLIVLVVIAAGTSMPTPSKAQGLVEYALILVLVYGGPRRWATSRVGSGARGCRRPRSAKLHLQRCSAV